MLGAVVKSWCPYCHCPPGPDCPDTGKSTRAVKRAEDRELRAYVSRLWAEDWDSPEDAVYDPLVDPSDCRHGCNGDCLEWSSPRCDFTCHEVA